MVNRATPNLPSRDLAATAAFYTRLGFVEEPYGREPEQRAEIIRHVATVEPLLRRGATIELDGRKQPAELADIIERLAAHVP